MTRTVTGPVEDGEGNRWANFTITFRVTPATATATAIIPTDDVIVTTDEDGDFTADLVTGIRYEVRLTSAFVARGSSTSYPAGTVFVIVVPDGDTPVSLASLHATSGTPPTNALQAIIDTLEGTIAGKADAADVTSLAETVEAKADAADVTAIADTVATKADASIVTSLSSDVTTLQGQIVQTTVSDGVGEWWIHPLATYQDAPYARTVFGAISETGKVLACEFNHGTGQTKRYEVGTAAVDDHNCPALWVSSGRRSVMTWTNHGADNFLHVRVGSRKGDLGSMVGATAYSQDVVGNVSYTQVHRIEHLSDDDQDTFWVFCRRGIFSWIIQPVTVVQATGGVTFGSRLQFVSVATDRQIYASTADAHLASGNQVIRAAITYNPAQPQHAIFYVEIDCVTGTVTSPFDADFTATLGTAFADTGLDPAIAEPAAGNSRRLFYVRPGPDDPAIAYADWATGAEDSATYKVLEVAAERSHLLPSTGYAVAAYNAAMHNTAGFQYTAIVKTPSVAPSASAEIELGRRYTSTAAGGWFFRLVGDKKLRARIVTGVGAIDRTSAETVPFTWGDTIGLRITVDDAANTVVWAYSLNPHATSPTWTNLATSTTISGAIVDGLDPLIVPTNATVNQFAIKVYAAHLRTPAGTLLAGVDWRTEWQANESPFTDTAGRSWSLSGAATIFHKIAVTTLGVSGPRIGYSASSNYIGGLSFENPSQDRVVLQARSGGGVETVEKLRLGSSGAYTTETVVTQPTAQGRLARPYCPINGGPFAAIVTNITSYEAFTDYAGHVRGVS